MGSETRRRQRVYPLRFDEDEYSELKAAADRASKSLSVYIRERALAAARRGRR